MDGCNASEEVGEEEEEDYKETSHGRIDYTLWYWTGSSSRDRQEIVIPNKFTLCPRSDAESPERRNGSAEWLGRSLSALGGELSVSSAKMKVTWRRL